MMTEKLSVIVLLLFLVASSGCIQESERELPHHHEVSEGEIGPATLSENLEKDSGLIVVDARSEVEFSGGHIPGALNLPLDEISLANVKEMGLTKEQKIIVYHKSSIGGGKARNILTSLGFENIVYLNGGITHWMEDGLSVVSGKPAQQTAKNVSLGDGPRIEFDRVLHKFGRIPQFGGNVSTKFTVSNTGRETLEIGYISTSCGCTSAEIEKKTIEPGEKTTLNVYFNPNLHEEPLDEFSRSVFIETNDPTNPEAEVKITLDILEGE